MTEIDTINDAENRFGETFMASWPKSLTNFVRTGLSKVGLDPAYHKVFAIGLSKTATTSIHQVFVECGLHAVHGLRGRRLRRPFAAWQWHAMSDQIAGRFRQLDREFPGARFILNTRDLTEWLDSRLQHIGRAASLGKSMKGEWAPGEAATTRAILSREAHHLAVLRYFQDRPGDLLIVNYIRDPDAVGKIAAFIDRPTPRVRPHVRSTPVLRRVGELANQSRSQPA